MIDSLKRYRGLLSLAVPGLVGACNETRATAPPTASTPSQPTAGVVNDPAEESTTNEPGQEGDDPGLPAAPRTASADSSPRALLSEVDRELGLLRSSAYTHATAVDEDNGVFDFDCSGFVGYALSGAAPAAWTELQTASTARKRPLAKHFEAFFESLSPGAASPHWRRVAHVTELQPADVIAWLKPPDVVTKNTGHVVIVHGPVTPLADSPGAFLVPVADSTSVLHGRGDSRKATRATGLGTGTLVLVADANGAPVAYRWSLGSRAGEHRTTVAMGRLTSP